MLVPGIPDNEDQDPDDVQPIMVPLDRSAYPVPATIMLRQVNRFAGGPGAVRVVGVSQWAITLNGTLVYCPVRQPRMSLAALVSIIESLGKLMSHQVRWWDARSWTGRPVWYQGVPARITHFWPERGQCGLVAEQGHSFVPQGHEIESDIAIADEERQVMMVDILSTEVTWVRTKGVSDTRSRISRGTQDQVAVVQSDDDSEAGGDDGAEG